VFCGKCTQYRRRLSLLATPDPNGFAYRVSLLIPAKSHLEFLKIEKRNREAGSLACGGIAGDFVSVMHAGKVAHLGGVGACSPQNIFKLGVSEM